MGDTLRCSIGLAPNRLLAKVASDWTKPDGRCGPTQQREVIDVADLENLAADRLAKHRNASMAERNSIEHSSDFKFAMVVCPYCARVVGYEGIWGIESSVKSITY